mmetsp:Transcript_32634/g.79146  ORF Transcript_32634/g.79146 Transcript_32634/m.79146 type:complete len:748 (+) Transcript_32634:349-2592(+)|eukprot:CAMPEP_0113628308 /NCGR_PEP_ID=MMETSP0017_2-20120614/14667_1 /TAXON_ID=2856 /ORGANISM="Cylindrotheca closterium" /LENGTH=747 /DNA_ID=CAMNT_0000538607 /DNA_START=253 /DNA_END=2496 /DNA_ORIENTATION=+ /assembly_acc=CAM_ASM_000147
MGNQPSSSRRGSRRGSRRSSKSASSAVAQDAKDALVMVQEGIAAAAKNLDESGTASQIIDSVCGGDFYDERGGGGSSSRRSRRPRRNRSYSDSEDDATYDEEGTYDDNDTYTDGSRTYDSSVGPRRGQGREDDESGTVGSNSYITEYTAEEDDSKRRRGRRRGSYESDNDDDESRSKEGSNPTRGAQPLASSFAKRCYFTKAGIGKTSQHYEGLTLTGNVVLMLSTAMKLKGCPTICDEDLRRVEQTYPNQFSRLPDELLLSSGWRRISKYCHFSKKPIPDGVPFFHSKNRLHHSGGYFFLLASSVGMIRPCDVEPLTKDTLVLLETDFPNQCDAAPQTLVEDPNAWTLVDKFCFFSGGPINTEEDVYYQADFDGNPIFMLAFLSPSLTPEELYKINSTSEETGLKTMKAIEEVESIYDLTERDFDDLKLYHLGPCRALPQYILQPTAWTKVLPPHFNAARNVAIARAQQWQAANGHLEKEEGVSARLKQELDNAAAQNLNMNAPDPDDPILSPTSTFLPDAQFFNKEPSPTVPTTPASNSFKEDEKKTEDEMGDKKMEDKENDDKVVEKEEEVATKEAPFVPAPLDTSIDSLKSGEGDFTPIKRDGYKLGNSPTSNPASPQSTGSTGSAAMRGAQELIRKKRAQRMEISKRHSGSRPTTPEERDGNSSSPASNNSFGEIGPQDSSVSDESQVEKNSRRAMIVKMAKARMANNTQGAGGDEVSGSSSLPSVKQGNSDGSWDIAGDLD